MDHDEVIDRVLVWARAEDNVRAVVLTGSAAVGHEQMDEFSDLDIELYAIEPSKLLDDDSWYVPFGEVLVVEALSNPGWHPTRLVYYVGGKIDFMIGPVDALPTTRYGRPFRVLLDKDKVTDTLTMAQHLGDAPPEPATVLRCIHWFYAAALMCAKCVVRDEPWMAKVRDWDLKRELLHMIEWDHKTRHGWSYDTWYNGKHLNRWVDEDIRVALDACWAGFAVSDTARALVAVVDLFDTLSTRTVNALGMDGFDAGRVQREIDSILAKANRAG